MARTISNSYTITQSITTTTDNPVTVSGAINVAGSGVGVEASVASTITVTGEVAAGGVGIRLHAGGTVTDAGFISGGPAAVAFYPGFTNLLIVKPGAVLLGKANGGNTIGAAHTSTLELAQGTGTTAGTITNFGSSFLNFSQLTIDPNFTWWLAGNSTIANGVTLTAIGTMVANGTMTNAGFINGAVEVYTGAILKNLVGATIYSAVDAVLLEGPSTFTNQGGILSIYAPIQFDQGGTFTNAASGAVSLTGTNGGFGVQFRLAGSVDNAGLITNGATGYAVHFNEAGTVANEAGATIVGAAHGIGVDTGAGSVGNAGTITGGYGVLLHSGGIVTNFANGHIVGTAGNAIMISGGGSVTNAGSIGVTGANTVAIDLLAGADNRVAVAPGAAFGGVVRGGNTVHAAAASVLELISGVSTGTVSGVGTGFVNFNTIAFDGGAVWKVSGSTAGLAGGEAITGFARGDTIELTNLNAAKVTLANGTLSLTGSIDLLFPGTSYGLNDFSVTNGGTNTDISIVACFRAGTRILTEAGELPVEAVRPGMRVVSLTDQRAVAVTWVGSRTLAHTPVVRIAAGAFGEGAPHREVFLSPDHAVFVDGALIPVRHLVNGSSVAVLTNAEVTYVHVELAAHAVLLAEGLPAESYLDTGNRAALGPAMPGEHPLAESSSRLGEASAS